MSDISASRPATLATTDCKTGPFGRVSSRETMATVLTAAAVAALAITSLIQSHQRATAWSAVLAGPAASLVPTSAPPDTRDVGPFAFGHLVFDWNPAAPGGVPGFDSWPPGSRR
jgi:hypothetical protein